MQTFDRFVRATSRPYSRRSVLRGLGVGGAGLLAASALACSSRPKGTAGTAASATPAGAQGSPQPGGTYNSFLTTNPTLDPMAVSQVGTLTLANGVMSRLFRFKTGADPSEAYNHDIESDLGLTAESPDAVTWTIKLRPGAKFHDVAPVNGHAVEAEDIKATFTRALTLTQNANRAALAMIDQNQVQTPAADTVVFKLNYPYAPFQKTIASPIYSTIYPREALAGAYDPAKQSIGSGPFIFDSLTPDVSCILKRNPAWFQQGQPYVDRVNFSIIPAAAQQMAQFQSGHLDDVSFGPDQLDSMKKSVTNAAVLRVDPDFMGTLYFQMGDPTAAFQDIRVRQAIAMAIDYDAIGKSVFAGQYIKTLTMQPSFGKWTLLPDHLDSSVAPFYQYNPDQSKKLLQAAGVQGQSFKLAYVASGGGLSANPWYVSEAEAVANMLNAVGLKVDLVQLDFSKDYVDAGKGYRQGYFAKDTIFFGANQPYTDVDEEIYNYFDSGSLASGEHLKDTMLDGLIAKSRTLVNEDERLKAELDIQRYLAQQVYSPSVGGGYNFLMVQPRVQSYQYGNAYAHITETYSKVWLKG